MKSDEARYVRALGTSPETCPAPAYERKIFIEGIKLTDAVCEVCDIQVRVSE